MVHFLTSLFIILFTFVADARTCFSLFDSREMGRQHLETLDLEEVAVLFKQKDETGQIPYMQIFQVYLEARLKTVPEEWRDEIRNYLPRIFYRSKQHDASASTAHLPFEFKDSILPFFILAHEVEHRIQMAASRYSVLERLFGVISTYRLEKEAMESEWEFLSMVPQVELARAMDIVQTAEIDRPRMKNFLTSALELSIQKVNRETYIQRQHKMGRYSYSRILLEAANNWGYVGLAGMACGLIYHLF